MSEKKVLIITIVILVLVVVCGGAAVWWFQFNVLDEKKQQLASVTQQVDDAENKVKKIPKLKTEIAEIEKEIAVKQERIPNLDRLEYDRFANLLDQKRRRAGVFVTQGRWQHAKASQAAPGRPAVRLPATMHKVEYDMSVRGGFYQLLKYVNLLEEERRFINVESFTIVPAGGGEKGNLVRELKLKLFSYTYRPSQPEPPPEVEERRPGISTPIPE